MPRLGLRQHGASSACERKENEIHTRLTQLVKLEPPHNGFSIIGRSQSLQKIFYEIFIA
jgi:hypothetical protein